MISERAKQIVDSPTLRINAKARAMKAEGIDVIDLSVGEPDFPSPENIKIAGKKAIDANVTKYTANEGIPELKKAIIKRLKEDHNLDYSLSEIIVSNGAKHSLYNLILAVINDGEEVIIPIPYWVSYPEMVLLARGKSVYIEGKEENGFKITAKQLKASITPNTKAIIINNPSNPTGAVYTRSELEEIVKVCLEENLLIIADEIYEKLVYEDFQFCSIASLGQEAKKRTVLVNGVSKAYSMTGWRIGYAVGPAEIISAMGRIQGHSTSNPCSISQMACVEAFSGPQYEISKMRAEFQRRRNYILQKLSLIQGISCQKPDGAFYVFPNVSAYYDKEYEGVLIRNSYGMAYYLLKYAGVAIVPGDAFGADDYIRISYATSMENIEKAMERMIGAFRNLKTPKKVKLIALSNAITKVKKMAPIELHLNGERKDALVAEAQSYLNYDNYYEWNSNINGVIIQLRTNVSHLNDFWVENWYPAQLEADIEPHGIIYAVDGVSGREPYAYYSSDTKTAIIFNTDYYATLRSIALGMVTDISERLFDVHAIRGMSIDIDGQGVVIIGPPGTKKTELFYGLLKEANVCLHSAEYMFVRYSMGFASGDSPERKFYIPTNACESLPLLAKLFDRSKCENVITKKEDCKEIECQQKDDCRLDKGSPYCYKASKNSYVMLDPYWLGGMRKHVKRIDVKYLFLLRNDPITTAFIKLDSEEAIRILEMGQSSGTEAERFSFKNQPFFNPHLVEADTERIELQKKFFRRLFKTAICYQINVGTLGLDEIIKKILGMCK